MNITINYEIKTESIQAHDACKGDIRLTLTKIKFIY